MRCCDNCVFTTPQTRSLFGSRSLLLFSAVVTLRAPLGVRASCPHAADQGPLPTLGAREFGLGYRTRIRDYQYVIRILTRLSRLVWRRRKLETLLLKEEKHRKNTKPGGATLVATSTDLRVVRFSWSTQTGSSVLTSTGCLGSPSAISPATS